MKTLRPHKHKKLEFFITDEINICTFRNEMASMEHPFFALKGGDTNTRKYQNGPVTITIRSLADLGLATIFDKDVWIYAISKIQEAINNNKKINRKITFTSYNFFITTNRDKSGRAYKDFKKSLSRLKGTVINTNIIYSQKEQKTEEFSLIDHWRIIERKRGKLDINMVEITLPKWLYQAVKKTKVLKISPDYFRIRKAIDRRIYEIAKKHCGNQNEFIISLHKLHLKTGSTSTLAKFKFNMKRLIKINDLPDYKIAYNETENQIAFINRSQYSKRKEISHIYKRNKYKIHKIKNQIRNAKKKLKIFRETT